MLVGIGLVLLPALAFVALHLPVVQRALVSRALDSLRASADLDVTVANVRVSPMRLVLVATGVRVAARQHPEVPLLEAEQLELDIARVALTSAGQTLAIERLILDGPVVRLRRDADGQWNLPRASSSAPEAEPPLVTIDHLDVRRGTVSVEDVLGGLSLQLTNLTVTPRSGLFTLTGDVAAHLPQARVDGSVASTFEYDGHELALRSLSLHTPEGTLQAEGTTHLQSGEIRLTAHLGMEARALGRLVALPDMSGTLRTTATITGSTDAPRVAWDVVARDLTDGASPLLDLEGEGSADTSAVRVDGLTGRVAGGQLAFEGTLGLDPSTPTAVELRLQNARVPDLLRGYAPSAAVGGRIDVAADATGPGLEWIDWATTASLQVRADPDGRNEQGLPLDGVASVRVRQRRWSLEANLALPEVAVAVAQLDGMLAPALQASTIAGAVRIDVDDLAAATATMAGAAADLSGRASLDARFAGTVSAPRARWTLDASAGTSMLARAVAHATGTASLARVRADTITVTSGPNTLTAHVSVGLDESRPVRGSFRGSFPVLPSLFEADAVLGRPLTGAASIAGSLGGTLASPSVRADVGADGLSYAGQIIDAASGRLSLRGRQLEVSGFEARAGGGRATGELAFDLGRHHHVADVVLVGWPVRPLPPTADAETVDGSGPPGVPVRAVVDATIDTRGSVVRPAGAIALDVRDLTWQDHPLGALTLQATSDGRQAGLTFGAPGLHAAGTGRLELATTAYDLAARIERLTLDPIRPWLPVSFAAAAGDVSADISLEGRVDDLAASTSGELRLDALHLAIGQARLSLDAPATVAGHPQRVSVAGLRLRSGDLMAEVDGEFGRVPAETPLTMTLDGPIVAAQPWLDAFEVPVPQVSGAVRAGITLRGTFDAPLPSATVEASNVAIAIAPAAPAVASRRSAATRSPVVTVPTLAATLDSGVVTLQPMTAEWDEARLAAAGRLPLRLFRPYVPAGWHTWLGGAEGPATVTAQTTSLDTRLIEPFLGPDALANVSGQVTARLAAEAAALSWPGVSGTLTLDQATFRLAGLPLAQARPTVVRLTDGVVEVRDVLFSGPNTDMAIDGSADLTAGSPVVDVQLRGLTDLAILRPFLADVVPGGRAEVNLHARGSLAEPSVTGELLLTDAAVRIAEPRLALELLNGTATFTGRQMTMPALRGVANGAPATISAALLLGADNTPGGQLRLRASGLPLEYPAGMRTESDIDILASLAGRRVNVTGTVDVLRGVYREPIALAALSSGLLTAPGADVAAVSGGTSFDVRFDVQVQTRDALRVDNNYGRLSAEAALRLIGTLDRPALSGRVTLAEGGELYLGGLTYRVERGAVDFANPQRIEPIVDLAAETRTRGERIRIEASGTPDTLDVTLSAPDASTPLSQAELASLLVSGRTLDDLSGTAAGEQALGLLSADLLGVVGRGIGLDALRLDRDLLLDDRASTGDVDVAAETDPVARLTLAKRLHADVGVLYSQNLRDASEITWLVTWTPFRRIELRLLQRDDRSMSYEFRHEVVFGAPVIDTPGRETPPRVREVDVVAGDPALRDALLRQLRLDTGDRFDFYRWQDDRDRLDAWLHEARHYEHRLTARRHVDDGEDGPVVDLRYEVTPGPRATLAVDGAALDVDTLERMREAWSGSVFDGFLRDDLARIAREAMIVEGHPLADVDVTTSLSSDASEKTARVRVTPGPEAVPRLEVQGVVDDRLRGGFEAWLSAGAARTAWFDTTSFTEAARTWLRSRGALAAEVSLSAPVLQQGEAVRTVQVDGGVPYGIAHLRLSGVPDVRQQAVLDELGLSSGDPYDVVEVDAALRSLERWYTADGFRDVEVGVATSARHDEEMVDLDVSVAEGARTVVVETRIAGARLTQAALLDRALALPLGTIATPTQLLAARKRLYDTGVLSSVDVETTPVGPVTTDADGTLQQQVMVIGTVQEMPRLRLRYGLAVNDDVLQDDAFRATSSRRATPGLSALLENRNLLGRAVVGGLSARYERTRQSGRTFLTSPSLFGRDIRLQASSGVTRARLAPDVADSPLDVRTDATFGATQRLPGLEGLRLTYGYRYERSRTYDPDDPDLFDITITAPRLTSTVYVDRRDDPIDSTRGWFHASTVEVSRGWVGSDFEFLTYYGQQAAFRQLGRVVLAGRTQLGLGRGFGGQELLGSERFLAGGAVSVRGYGESVIGELDPILGVARGDGLVVFNGEVRMPLWRWISGVGFVDGGGVFDRVSDVTFGGLQWGAGAGVRVSTPAGLVRIDLGVPMQRRPLDRAWRVYVGLGQVF